LAVWAVTAVVAAEVAAEEAGEVPRTRRSAPLARQLADAGPQPNERPASRAVTTLPVVRELLCGG